MGRIYTAVFKNVAETTSGDILQIVNNAAASSKIVGASYTQTTEAGDAAAEQGLIIVQRASAAGTGGTSVTPSPMDPDGIASKATVLHHNTADATGLTELLVEGFNWQIGWFWTPTNNQEIEFSGGDIIVFNLGKVPADPITASMTVWFEEV